MNRWIRRILVILQIGGGFAGISFIGMSQPWRAGVPLVTQVLLVGSTLLFLVGIVAGLLLSEDSDYGLIFSCLYQAAQIPVLTSVAFTYKMMSGALVGFGVFGSKFLIIAELGAHTVLLFGQPTSAPGAGINILALFFLFYLLRIISKRFDHDSAADAAADSPN